MEAFKFSHPILNDNRYPVGGRRDLFYDVFFKFINRFCRSWTDLEDSILMKPIIKPDLIVHYQFCRRWRSLTSRDISQIF